MLVITKVADADTGTGKFIEISNTGAGPIDMTGITLETYFNGSATAGNTETLTDAMSGATLLQPGETITFYATQTGVTRQADDFATYGSVGFTPNGNDALVLRAADTSVLDSIGEIGVDADFGYADGQVLVRTTPDTDPTNAWTETAAANGWDDASGELFGPNGELLDATGNSLGVTLCFAEGTLIATPTGEVAVETLGFGDKILTADGRDVPVRWLGRQTVVTRFNPAERLMPVRMTAGALGHGLPHTDLIVTADHGMMVDGYLINAAALVNGDSIDFVPLSEMGARFTVYHIETEAHDVILANGTPSETYIDYVGRQTFDNYAEYEALYGDERIIDEMPLPRISAARLVPQALRERLAIVRPRGQDRQHKAARHRA